MFYAILTYALVFTAQHSVTLAAQDGARKVLQWQPGAASLQCAPMPAAIRRWIVRAGSPPCPRPRWRWRCAAPAARSAAPAGAPAAACR
ncbi:TadE family protein [Achromobacter xylosoxidans]